jgi:predicted metal-dependent hydrolase
MANSKIINIDELGLVLFEKSRRAKRVVISVRPGKSVRVAVPLRVSLERALEFTYLSKGWILKQLVKMEKDEIRNKPLKDTFTAIDKAEAKKKLKDRLFCLAEKHGFKYNKVSIRNQKTRWGSCSRDNNISLNMKLILLPEELMDYVLLHEMVHTRIRNHGRQFWNELDRYSENSRTSAKKLKIVYSGLL